MESKATQTDGGKFDCKICEYKARDSFNLGKHNKNMHLPRQGVRNI